MQATPAPESSALPIRPAATVLVCRDSEAGPEVLMIQRHALSDVHGGSYVFPGGKLDAADALLDAALHLDAPPAELHPRLHDPAIDAATAAALHVAAVREVFEECGLLLAEGLDLAGARQAAALAAQRVPFNEMLARLGLRLATHAMRPWSRWITPAQVKIRFDTHFFLAPAPADAAPQPDGEEIVDHGWFVPDDALQAYARGELELVFPTIKHLEQLSRFATADELFDYARGREVVPIEPKVIMGGDTPRVLLPGEPGYDDV